MSTARATGAGGDDRPRFGRESVDPFTDRNGLAGQLVGAISHPVALRSLLVGDRAFDR